MKSIKIIKQKIKIHVEKRKMAENIKSQPISRAPKKFG